MIRTLMALSLGACVVAAEEPARKPTNAALAYWRAFAMMQEPKEAARADVLRGVADGTAAWDPSLAEELGANGSALAEMRRVIEERYSPADWNIYAAQASDGDNTASDNAQAAALLEDVILPMCQYFAYIEVGAEYKDWLGRETDLWRTYKTVLKPGGNLAMRKVRVRSQIFPVFRDLFAKDRHAAAVGLGGT